MGRTSWEEEAFADHLLSENPWRTLGAILGRFWRLRELLGAFMEVLGGLLVPYWRASIIRRGVLDVRPPLWSSRTRLLGRFWGALGELVGAHWGLLGSLLGLSWTILRPP